MHIQTEALIRTICLQDNGITPKQMAEAIAVLRGERVAVQADKPKALEPVLKRHQVATLLGISVKGVDYHAKRGRLVRVKLGSRACGFSADSVRRLMNGEEA